MLTRSAPALVANQSLVSKVFFPRMVVPLSCALAVGLKLLVALAFGLVLVVVNGLAGCTCSRWPSGPSGPPLGGGIGLAASAIMVRYRDVAYVLPWLVQVGMYASPVGYALSAVPEGLRLALRAQPDDVGARGFPVRVVWTSGPSAGAVVGTSAVCLAVFVLGALVVQQQERGFADLI